MRNEQEPREKNPVITIHDYALMSPRKRQEIMGRSGLDIGDTKQEVLPIINNVRYQGDLAVLEYIERFDGIKLEAKDLTVSANDIEEAYVNTDPVVLKAIKRQIELSRKFHKEQLSHIDMQWEKEISPGVKLGQKKTPLESAGLYVPGGTAPYPTVMQILAVPAKETGVRRIVGVVSPRGKNYEVIVAGKEAGVDEMYRISGVAAIAALAYGTETIKPVDKIVGPGNKYVTAAKEAVFGDVGIDMPAGPSEVLILADGNANPRLCAGDLLSACEHDPNAAGVLVTWDRQLAKKVQSEIEQQTSHLLRQEIIRQALGKYSGIIVVADEREAVDFANKYAPEHLEVVTDNCRKLEKQLTNAGSIFLGQWTPKALGDYATGANHVLPTGKGARIYSPIGIETFMKTSQIQQVTQEGLENLASIVEPIAGVEGLGAHWKSIQQRLKK